MFFATFKRRVHLLLLAFLGILQEEYNATNTCAFLNFAEPRGFQNYVLNIALILKFLPFITVSNYFKREKSGSVDIYPCPYIQFDIYLMFSDVIPM